MDNRYRLIAATSLIAGLAGATALLLHGGIYGLTLFLCFPVFLGALSVLLASPESGWKAAGTGMLAALMATGSLLVFGAEGFVCIFMTLPLALPLGGLGGWLAFKLDPKRLRAGWTAMILLVPMGTLGWDTKVSPPVFAVQSALEIAAPPEQVWKHVVSFSELPAPKEWLFQTGLAYPMRARIEGSGVGAVRYCEFSTGAFVEPIELWDAPHLLQFRVTSNPPPMHEWSPYGEILPKHLNGYLVSKRGEFRLTRIAHNRTLLQGSTWYQHGLWPATYWRWWSDAIIHRIHVRVLTHIRTLAEAAEHP